MQIPGYAVTTQTNYKHLSFEAATEHGFWLVSLLVLRKAANGNLELPDGLCSRHTVAAADEPVETSMHM